MREPHSQRDTVPLGAELNWVQRLSTRKGMAGLAIVSLLLLALAGMGGVYALQTQAFANITEPKLTPPTSLGELATQYPELAGILQDPALDSAYKDFLLAYEQGGEQAALDLARNYGLVNKDDELRITLELDTNDLQALIGQLEANGIRVTASSDNLIDIAVPLDLIVQAMEAGDPGGLFADLTELEHIVRIRLPRRSIEHAGKIETESLGVINATAWQAAGFTGKGIKVGILDLGFNKYRPLMGKDLPSDLKVRSFISGVEIDETDTEHGTAVAEIIHDIAPDSQLFLAAYDTDTEQRQAVDWLVAQGVNIISHSAGSIYGPMDGTGAEARMVERIFTGGVLWVNSAGNMGESHYRGTFVDEDGDGFHEFSPGDELMGFSPQGESSMALNWDAWDSGDQDLDLYVMDEKMNRIVGSEDIQNGPGDETAEFISYTFPNRGPYYIAIRARRVTRPVVMDFYIYNIKRLEYITPEFSITTPGDSKGALAVAATFWSDDILEAYSSQGPTHDGRTKPDISAPTGVQSAAYGEEFYGTSAAAPHVAGAAALVWEAFPSYKAQQISDFLKSRAIDLGASGLDNQFGIGRLWLGDAPAPGVLPTEVPMATVTQTRLAPTVTQTIIQLTSTLPPTQIATPTLRPTSTPLLGLGSSDASWMLPLGLLACIVLPGLLGAGGLGLLGVVWYFGRRGRRPRRSTKPSRAPGAARPVAGGQQMPPQHLPAQPPVYGTSLSTPGQTKYAHCPRCGTLSRPDVRFCRACGMPLAAAAQAAQPPPPQPSQMYCIRCGSRLRPQSKFCPNCGQQR
ncbi:MAG: S8 family serine peptidase [Chloroflexota bacterium]